MPYIGRGLTTGAQYQKLDAIAINNATTFTMSVGSANVSPDQNHLILVVNGVIQEPGTGFTVAGSTCTLASAITTSGHSGLDTIYGVIAGDAAFAAYDSIGANALGVTAGTVTASRAIVPDGNKDIASFRNVTLTGELDAATLDISGNADIDGTTNLDAVDIDGAVQIDSTVTVGVDDTGHDVKFFGATATNGYLLWDESIDDLILGSASKLGIGCTPTTKLQIKADSDEEDVILLEDNSGTDIGAIRIHGGAFMMKGKSSTAPIQLQTHDGNEDIEVDPDGFIKFETAGSERMRITSVGQVLIGSTTEVSIEAIYNGVQLGGNAMFYGNNDTGASNKLVIGQNVREEVTSGDYTYISTDQASMYIQSDGKHLFYTAPSGSANATATMTKRMEIDDGGDVTMNQRLYVTDGSASYPAYSFSGDPDIGMYKSGANEIGFATNGTHRVSIEDDGIVQIAQNDAGDGVLRINGTGANDTNIELQNDSALKWRIRNKGNESDRIEIRDAGSDDGVIMAQGATAFSSGSDERLKCNWTSFDNALSDINSLTKVGTFQYKNFGEDEPRNDKVHSGLSAQEVQKFLPSAVDANEEGEKFLYLRYQELIPVLVKSIQELSAEVEALKNG